MRLSLWVSLTLLICCFLDNAQSSVYINTYDRHDFREFFYKITKLFRGAAKPRNPNYAVIMVLNKAYRFYYQGAPREGWIYEPDRFLYHYTDATKTTKAFCSETPNALCLYPDPSSTTRSSAPPTNRLGNYFVVNTGSSTVTGLTTAMVNTLLNENIRTLMHEEFSGGHYPDILMYSDYMPNDNAVVNALHQRLQAWSSTWRSEYVCFYFTRHSNYLVSAYSLTTQDNNIIANLKEPDRYNRIQTGVITIDQHYFEFYTKIHAEFKTSRRQGRAQFAVMIYMEPTARNDWIRNPKAYMYMWDSHLRATKILGTQELKQAHGVTCNPAEDRVGNYVVYNLKISSQRSYGGTYDPNTYNWQHSEHGILRHYESYLLQEFGREYDPTWVPEVLLYTWIFPCKYCSRELINIFRPTTGTYAGTGVSVAYTTTGRNVQYVYIDTWRPRMNDVNILTFWVDVNDDFLQQNSRISGVCSVNRHRREVFSNCDTAQTCMMECLRVNSECFRLCCCCEEDSVTQMVAYTINSIYGQCHSQSTSMDEKRTCWRNWLDRNIGNDCACTSKTLVSNEYMSCLESVTEGQYTIGKPLNAEGKSEDNYYSDIKRYQFIRSKCLDQNRYGFMCTLDKEDNQLGTSTSIRLVDGNAFYEGRVEAKNSQGAWGLVCDDFFDLKDAAVVCRQLKFDVAQEVLAKSHFGEGSYNFVLDDLGCRGTETNIFSCPNSGIGRSDCRAGEAVGVRCAVFSGLDNDDTEEDVDEPFNGEDDVNTNIDPVQIGTGTGQMATTTQQATDCSAFNVDEMASGVYEIGSSSTRFNAYCDFKTSGGGWTLIQRRVDGSEDFYKNWVEYEEGFGDLTGNHWLGLKKIYELTNSKTYRLRVDMTNFDGKNAYAEFASFRIESWSHECPYCLRLGEFSGGNAGDSMGDSDPFTFDGDSNVDQPFSTKDRLNAGYSYSSCVEKKKAGWWFSKGGLCGNTNPNGKYHSTYSRTSAYYPNDIIFWYTWNNDRSPLKTIEMKIIPTT